MQNDHYENRASARQNEQHAVEEAFFPDSIFFGSDVSVHDPAIFCDPKDGSFYVFGSHFALATSHDLICWRQLTHDGQYQLLFGGQKWQQVMPKGYAHANKNVRGATCGSAWAPDIRFHNGKYYMYASLSTFGVSTSAIVRVEADSVLGPYKNEQVIITSDQSGEANCIDPQIFLDDDGRLYLLYGSFFGGIFIKELENEGARWGLCKSGGFGKLLWKGEAPPDAAQGGPEGAFLFKRGGYYYLMVSDGSLFSNYHLRVARSQKVSGPYCDITGEDMAGVHGSGNKLAGNWRFANERGLAAYGHNSVYERNGEYFVIGHMRYEHLGRISGAHFLRVHRLLFNKAGWPVLSPMRYAGEKLGNIPIGALAGEYDLILHDSGRSKRFAESVRYTLTPDKNILRGNATVGKWSYQEEGNFVDLTIEGTLYRGVALPVFTQKGGTIALSATSNKGTPLWARRRPEIK